MNDETKMVITHADLCRAVELWLETKVLTFAVDVSSTVEKKEYNTSLGFELTFKRRQNPEKSHDAANAA